MTVATASSWLLRPLPRAVPRLRLICFPYAGGGANVYRDWAPQLPDFIEVWAVEPPGRGMRFHEPLLRSVAEHVEALSHALVPLLDLPYAFFGHSMGALVAFELARSLRAHHPPGPRRLFVSGCGAPTVPNRRELIHALPDDRFARAIAEFNGCPEELLADRELRELFLPILRADFTAVETYGYALDRPLECPIDAFYGIADSDALEHEVREWQQQTSGSYTLTALSGDHFFVRTQASAVLEVILSRLQAEPARAAP